MTGGRIISTVIRFTCLLIWFVVCGVVAIVAIGTINEETAVKVLYVKSSWVSLRQPVNSFDYVLRERQRRKVLVVKPPAGSKDHKIIHPLCVSCRKELYNAGHTGLHCVVVRFVVLGILPEM